LAHIMMIASLWKKLTWSAVLSLCSRETRPWR
jgi:hypothetical protein